MNRAIHVLRRELERLNDLGRSATVENYKPERVERAVNACCKQHRIWRGKQGMCRYEALCKELYDRWSDEAPISYSPAIIDKLIRSMDTGDWMPKVGEDILAELKYQGIIGLFPLWTCHMLPLPAAMHARINELGGEDG